MGTLHHMPPRDTPAPPSNIEAEQALLGAILVNNEAADQCAHLRPEHFFERLHARIYEAIITLRGAGKLASPVTLASFFRDDPTMKEIGGPVYLARLAGAATTIINAPEYARTVFELSQRRQVIDLCRRTAETAASPTIDMGFRSELSEHISEAHAIFDDTASRRSTVSIGQAGSDVMSRIRRLQAGDADPTAVYTGIQALDRHMGGLRRAEYVVLGGRPSMGKTAVAVQVAMNVAEAGHGVGYFSLEMGTALLAPRFISSRLWTSGVDMPNYQSLLRGSFRASAMDAVDSASKELASLPLTIDDTPALTAAELEARARVMASRFKTDGRTLGLIVVDHLHKLRCPNALSQVAAFTEISAVLAEMAKRLDCPVLALAQLNRSVESRDDKRPTLGDLRESGSIEQDADAVLFVYRAAYYLARSRGRNSQEDIRRMSDLDACDRDIELIIAKARSGPIGTVRLWADLPMNVIRDPADVAEAL